MIGGVAEVEAREMGEASDQEPSPGEYHQRECHLRGHERLAYPSQATALDPRARVRAKRR